MKHYKGTIYGKTDDAKWTQYFRTSENNVFYNHIRQNEYHVNAVKNIFPNIPVFSYIVFTSDDCILRIDNKDENIKICTRQELRRECEHINEKQALYKLEDIDGMFCHVLPYAPIMSKSVVTDEKQISFGSFIDEIKAGGRKLADKYEEQHKSTEALCEKKVKAARKSVASTVTLAILICVACVVLCVWACSSYAKSAEERVKNANDELNSFKQKFEQVEQYNGGHLDFRLGVLDVYDVIIDESKDLEKAIYLSFSIRWNGQEYGMGMNKNTVLQVLLKNGDLKEYHVYNKATDLLWGHQTSAWYTVYTDKSFEKITIYDVSLDEISYIKIGDVFVWEKVNGTAKKIATGYEIEIYNAQE